jgi:hypothetical protein
LAEALSSGSQDFSQELQQVPVIFDIGIGRIARIPSGEAFSLRRSSMRVEVPKETNRDFKYKARGG